MSATVTLDFGQKKTVEAPLWAKGIRYKDRVAEIGEHWSWAFDYRGFPVRVHVPLSLGSDDVAEDEWLIWADARKAADERYQEIFSCYPDRNDMYSSPSENAEMDSLPPGLGTILHYKVNEITTKEVAE